MLSKLLLTAFIFLVLASAAQAEDIGCCAKYAKETNVLTTVDLTQKQCDDIEKDYAKTEWDVTKRALGNKCEVKLDTTPSKAGEITEFTPQVTIPGSEYVAGKPVKLAASTKALADYVIAIFKYSIGVIGIISAIVLMVGGVRWLTAGGNATAVGEAKSYIISSLTGLALTFGSFLLLSSINADLSDLKVTPVKRLEYVSLKMGCCLKTDKTTNAVTAETMGEEACSKIDYATTIFTEGYIAQDNKCVENKGCCQITVKLVGTKLRAFSVEKEADCNFDYFKRSLKSGLPFGASLVPNFEFMRGKVPVKDLIAPNPVICGDKDTPPTSNCLAETQTGCSASAVCCSGLKCATGGTPSTASCASCIPEWYYGCSTDSDCCSGMKCENDNTYGLRCVKNQ